MKFELAPDNRGQPDSVLIEDLLAVANALGKNYVPREEYLKHGRFAPKTLVNRFGTWNKALKLAGLSVQKPNNLNRDECLDDLRRVASLLGTSVVTIQDYRRLGQFSERPFRRIFGSWVAALREAGLQVSSGFRESQTNEELLKNLERVWRALGRQPKQSDMRPPLSTVSHDAYCRRFGSWRSALESFIALVNAEPQVAQFTQEKIATPVLALESATSQRTGRGVSWRLRFLVMRRDGFKCRHCGCSPATHLGTILVIDHIEAWSKGGETTYDNLQTLCEPCNGGKSDLSLNEV